MKPVKFDIEFTDEVIAARGGLALVGQLLGRMALGQRFDALRVGGSGSPTIGHGDVALAMAGLLCLAKPDFAAIEDDARAGLIALGLGMRHVPSEETLRQRLDRIGASQLDEAMGIVREASAQMVRCNAPALTPCLEHGGKSGGSGGRRWVALDVDVSVFDNSNTKKQGVGRTYKGCDGYAPIFAYLGEEGYMLDAQLREGTQHCQKDTAAFVRRSIGLAMHVLGDEDRSRRVLVRMDAGNDALENLELCRRADRVDYLVKRNIRRENAGEWLEIAQAHGACDRPREGKSVWRGDHWMRRDDRPHRVVFEVTERTITSDGQRLLVPEVEVATWWTSLRPTKVDAAMVIELYHRHATSEQFHAELKSDMDLERLPSGKFKTNALVLGLGIVAYNALRLVGQLSLDCDGDLPPDRRPPLRRDERGKPRVARRRLRTVIQDLMYLAVKLVRTGRRWRLRLSRSCRWSWVMQAIYRRLLTPV